MFSRHQKKKRKNNVLELCTYIFIFLTNIIMSIISANSVAKAAFTTRAFFVMKTNDCHLCQVLHNFADGLL